MAGGFAGGLADGLRNGMMISRMMEDVRDRREERERERRAREQEEALGREMAGGMGLADVAAPGQQQRGGGQAQGAGLMDVATVDLTDGSAPSAALPQAGQAGPAGRTEQAGASSAGLATAGEPFDLGKVADGLTRGYRSALQQGRPGRAMELLMQREKILAQHREQAFGDAVARYQLTGDPNDFVPFVNRFMPTSLEVERIEKRPEAAGGQPLYVLHARDSQTGQPYSQPFGEAELQSWLRAAGDPNGHRAMVVQQAKHLYDLEAARRKTEMESEAKIRQEAAKPRVLGKDDILYTPGPDGRMQVAAAGAEARAGRTRPVTSDKDFSSFVLKLNGVDSMMDLGQDQRQRIGEQISIGENINRLNAGQAGGQVLSQGNLAALAQRVQNGTAEIYPVQLGEGQFGFATDFEGQMVRLPVSVVPQEVQAQIREQIMAARQSGAQQAPAPQPEAAAAPAAAPAVDAGQPAPQGEPPAPESPYPEGAEAVGQQLDASRDQLRQAQAKLRDLRKNAPGLRAGAAARAAHAERIAEAERDVQLARAAVRGAEQQWSAAVQGSEVTRAAMGRANFEGRDERL